MVVSSCASLKPREEPAGAKLRDGLAQPGIPAWAKHRLGAEWWTVYGDVQLNRDIEQGLNQSPGLQSIGFRLHQAESQLRVARAAALPRLNLGYGFRVGRAKEVDFGPYDLKPWTGATMFQWELDLFRKLEAARESAEFARTAACWDLEAARLVLASRIARARFQIYSLRAEQRVLREAIDANADILKVLGNRKKAGLIAETEVHRADAEHEKLSRELEDLDRLRLLAEVELRVLKGGPDDQPTVDGRMPSTPDLPGKSFCELLASHPSLLASEARVRSAFRKEEVARLDLLPSINLRGNLMGASPHFFLDELATWKRELGPSLEIPIYDPERLATRSLRQAKTNEAAAEYRSELVAVVGDIDSAYINFHSRRRQLASAVREVESLARARYNVTANFGSGLVSQIEVLESERSHRNAERRRVQLKFALLRDHLELIKALGGGGDCFSSKQYLPRHPSQG